MGKLLIPRLALAFTVFGIFLLPPTEAFAKKTWLEKLFSGPQEVRKRRKPRPKAKAVAPLKVVTPVLAPIPEAKPATQPSADQNEPPQASGDMSSPEDSAQPAAPETELEGQAKRPPTPQPKPPVSAGGVPNDPSATMPENVDAVPIPEPSPRAIPEERPPSQNQAAPVEGLQSDPGHETPPAIGPIPQPNPRTAAEKPDEAKPDEDATAEPAEPPPPPDPRSALRPDPSGELPPDEIACRQRLAGLGVSFDNRPPQTDPTGCSVPYPLVVKSLGKDIGLKPDAEMNCAMAEASARFARDVVDPAAREIFGERLVTVSHASAYVCRPRNGTRKLSEHAFGNALDISSFSLSGGMTVVVEPAPPEKNGLFIDKVRTAACGPFKTVLGPGDPDHSEHLHFDLAPRRHGGTVCG